MVDPSEKIKEEITLSKRMFLAGCLGLPWLWICNALYFRLRVFGPVVLLDYWPGKSPPPQSDTDNNGENDEQEQTMEQQLELQMQKKEIEKWVRRSSLGAFIVMSLFVAWIVAFQVNKDHFGSGWFVMDPTDAEVSGW